MGHPLLRRLGRIADVSLPWVVGIFLVLVAGDDVDQPRSDAEVAIGMVLGVVQGAALHWRRRRPELVMAVTLVGGLGYWVVVPEIVLPIAAFFAIGSPPRVHRTCRSSAWRGSRRCRR
jgi:hypothetical protein